LAESLRRHRRHHDGQGIDTTINSGGKVDVNGSGTVDGATVNRGGTLVLSGGSATDTTVTSGGMRARSWK
jgi:autotransporter passenger strand-loop-strand repeat protein